MRRDTLKRRTPHPNIKMDPWLHTHWSETFYQRALPRTSPFRLKDIAQPSEREVAKLWLKTLVERGELRRRIRDHVSWYSWIND